MNIKILLLIFIAVFVQTSTLSLSTHDGNYDTCFYLPIGDITKLEQFNYTITSAWTPEQAAQLKSGALNTSDFIHVQGWLPYSHPNKFFEEVSKGAKRDLRKLTKVKDVLQGSDAPQYGLSNSDLQFAFGFPSQAVLYRVPSGKALIAIRFQASVSSNPYIGKWSVLVDLVEEDELEYKFKVLTKKLQRNVAKTGLNPLDVASTLNIIPSFIENSIFWTFSTSPAAGTVAPVAYQGFVVAIRGGEEVLAGPINDGQPGVIQVKDVVKDRSSCN